MITVIKGGALIDGRREHAVPMASLTLENGIITKICMENDGQPEPEADRVIAADGLWICPGLINAHVHLCMDGGKAPLHDLEKEPGALWLLKAVERCKGILKQGITTVRDLGSPDFGIVSLRDAIAQGLVVGPRLVVCGPALTMTGGHAPVLAETVDGVEVIRRAVRARIANHVDFIKVFATGGFGKYGEQLESYELTFDEIQSAVRAAGAAGKKVAAHAYGLQGIRNALLAGAASIEHATFLDAETISMAVDNGVILVPTLANTYRVQRDGEKAGLPLFMVETAKRVFPTMLTRFQEAYAAGTKLAAGTDAGSWLNPHDDLVTELIIRHQAGVTPINALRMATSVAAECLGLSDEIGTIAVGKRADLILVEQNPLDDLEALRAVKMVIQDGRVI